MRMNVHDPVPEAPLEGFFLHVEKMATVSFLTIPYVGGHIAQFFNEVVIPFCTPGRNRIMRRIFRTFKGLEGGLQVLLMRLMPLPSGPPAPSQSPR
ncbi:MAG TPA: hypothetical protein VNM14_06675 [Planctomycetota bacterium]|nr:hypothetical protein [Planctomycetota bacterium]